jgi:hypothetical protein
LGFYIYSISASDTSGNWNNSLPQSFIIHDTDGPQIKEPDDKPTNITTYEEFIISVNVTDDINVSGVWINITRPDGTWINVTMNHASQDQWTYTTRFEDLGNYTYAIWSVDTSGNWNSSQSGAFSIEPKLIPPKSPRAIYMVLLLVYWPLLMILLVLGMVKKYNLKNRFSIDINLIAHGLSESSFHVPDLLNINENDIMNIMILCERTGIPPEEFILSRYSYENMTQILDPRKKIPEDDLRIIINLLKDGYKPPTK